MLILIQFFKSLNCVSVHTSKCSLAPKPKKRMKKLMFKKKKEETSITDGQLRNILNSNLASCKREWKCYLRESWNVPSLIETAMPNISLSMKHEPSKAN